MRTSISPPPNDAKQIFKKCGTCAQTFGHLLNRSFGHHNEEAERALDPLAGGILNHGQQCGMLWGASLAIGIESYRRYEDLDEAVAHAINASRHLVTSFADCNETVNCKEIIGYDLNRTTDFLKYALKTTLQGLDTNQCFNMAERWMPDAISAAEQGLSESISSSHEPRSCTSEMVKLMGASEEEMVMVAGLSGGLGLSGHGCGALSAAIWLKAYRWCKEHPGKNAPLFNNKSAKKLIKKFEKTTGGEYRCQKITGQNFDSLDKHSSYVEEGGCAHLLEALLDA